MHHRPPADYFDADTDRNRIIDAAVEQFIANPKLVRQQYGHDLCGFVAMRLQEQGEPHLTARECREVQKLRFAKMGQ